MDCRYRHIVSNMVVCSDLRDLDDAFAASLDAVQPRNRAAVDATTEIKALLAAVVSPIGPNDTAI